MFNLKLTNKPSKQRRALPTHSLCLLHRRVCNRPGPLRHVPDAVFPPARRPRCHRADRRADGARHEAADHRPGYRCPRLVAVDVVTVSGGGRRARVIGVRAAVALCSAASNVVVDYLWG